MSHSRTLSDVPNPRLSDPPALSSPDPQPGAASGIPYDEPADWGKIGALAAGILIGAVIGAGSALLLAPESGRNTRRRLRGIARGGRKRASAAWNDLGDELYWKSRQGRKKVRRGAVRGGWMMEDLLDGIIGSLGARPRRKKQPRDDHDAETPGRIIIEEE